MTTPPSWTRTNCWSRRAVSLKTSWAEAEQKASRMVDHSEIESRRTRSDSDAYVIESLKNLEREATQILGSVRKGIDSLSSAVHV